MKNLFLLAGVQQLDINLRRTLCGKPHGPYCHRPRLTGCAAGSEYAVISSAFAVFAEAKEIRKAEGPIVLSDKLANPFVTLPAAQADFNVKSQHIIVNIVIRMKYCTVFNNTHGKRTRADFHRCHPFLVCQH